MINETQIHVSYRCPKCDVLRGLFGANSYGKNEMDITKIELKCAKCKTWVGELAIETPSGKPKKEMVKNKRPKAVAMGSISDPLDLL